MRRRMVLTVVGGLVMIGGLTLPAERAMAQAGLGAPGTGLLADPFSFYYAIYLPNQQLQALRPSPLDPINQAVVGRQYFVQSKQRGLYDPISPFAESLDPLKPFSNQQERVAGRIRFSHDPSNTQGMGPTLYFNRMVDYYPDLSGRTGRRANASVPAQRARGYQARSAGGGMGGMGGGMGMPGMGMF